MSATAKAHVHGSENTYKLQMTHVADGIRRAFNELDYTINNNVSRGSVLATLSRNFASK